MGHVAKRRASNDRGFSLTEVLVVVVIIGVAAAIGAPRLTRERVAADGRTFAELAARELQRARIQAVATRLPQYAFVFADRIEIRTAQPGATPSAPLVAPTSADPILRLVPAKPDVTVVDVTTAVGSAPSAALSTATGKLVVFTTLGAGFLGPTAPGVPQGVYLYLDNAAVGASHPERHFRIDVAPLTGDVQLRTSW
jgi:prepilin-type N-terminal cleavage/methylation domain-containing protein